MMVRVWDAHAVAALFWKAPGFVLAVLLAWLGMGPTPVVAAPEAYLADSATLLVADTANPSIVARVPVGGTIAASPAVSASGLVYVPLASAVAIVDVPSRTVIETIQLSMVVSDATLAVGGRRLVLAGHETAQGVRRGVLSVVDTDARTAINVVTIGQSIGPMVVDPSGQRVYATYTDPSGIGGLVTLDASTGTLLSGGALPFDRAAAAAINPNRGEVYAARDHQVAIVDIAAQMVRALIALPVPLPPQRRVTTVLRADPSGDLLYVFGSDVGPLGVQGFMAVIDTRAAAVIGEVALPLSPAAAVVRAEREAIYVSGESLGACTDLDTCPAGPGGIALIDRVSYQVLTVVPTGQGALLAGERLSAGRGFPPSLQSHPDGKTLYAAAAGGRVSVLDLDSIGLVALFPGNGLAFGPELSLIPGPPRLYVVPAAGGVPHDTQFGLPGDHLLPGDYDGDRHVDQTVWRPRDGSGEGVWIVPRSSDGAVVRRQWGAVSLGDVPVPADYDGDGKLDIAIWRPFDGTWYVLRSSDGGGMGVPWGGAELGDIPVPADYDGDGRADIAVWRPGSGAEPAMWFIVSSRSGTASAVPLGVATDVPVPADYDGDGRVDPAVWRPATGEWLILGSRTGTLQTIAFGAPGDIPIPADYDGDGKADIAIWRVRTGEWFRLNAGSLPWGAAGDRPLAMDFDGDGLIDRALVRVDGAAAPALPLAPLTLPTSGDGQGTTAGAGSYAPGTAVPVTATASVGSAFAGWSGPPPCPQGAEGSTSLVMPVEPVSCTAVFVLSSDPSVTTLAATSSGAGWVALATGGGQSPSWSNLTTDAQGRVYSLNWAGELWRFDGATNTWANLGKFFSDSRHNCTITGDPLNNLIWLTGQCSLAADANWVYDVTTGVMRAYCRAPCGAGGSNAVGVFDPVNSRLLAWAGWLADLSYYNSMQMLALRPVAASWQGISVNPAPVPFGECDRLAHNRGGWDSRRNRAWIVLADGALWTFEAGAWTRRATVGGPPHACTVYAYHAGIDRIVGWTGVDYSTGTETPMVRQTWLLDPATLTWSAGPSAAGGAVVPPGGTPTINSITYDAVRQQVVMRIGQETWGFRADGSPLPTTPAPPPSTPSTPQVVTLTLAMVGDGIGRVVGGGPDGPLILPGTVNPGATVQLRAIPASGSTFGGWSPPPCAASFVMPAQSLTCTAQFTLASPPPQQFTVTLGTAGAGTGSVGGGGSYAAGAIVALTASAGPGSVFAGWSPAPCAPSFAMPANAVTCTATFSLPSGPGGPPSGTGDEPVLPLRTFVARPAPTGSTPTETMWLSPFSAGSKDVSFTTATDPVTGRSYILTGTGDYAQPPQSTGHNTVYRVDVGATANTWTMTGKPCAAAGQVSPPRPTDRGLFAFDPRGGPQGVLWQATLGIGQAPPGTICPEQAAPGDPTGSTHVNGLLRLDLATGVWTKLTDMSLSGTNEGVVIPDENILLLLDTDAGSNCSLGGIRVSALNLTTFVKTQMALSCHVPSPTYVEGGGTGWLGAVQAHLGRFAWDPMGKRAFICAIYQHYTASAGDGQQMNVCHRYDHAARTITPVAPVPATPVATGPLYIQPVYDSRNGVVLWPYVINSQCAIVKAMLVYTPATDTWESLPVVSDTLAANDIRGSVAAFDHSSNTLFLAGQAACEAPLSVSVPTLLWRYR